MRGTEGGTKIHSYSQLVVGCTARERSFHVVGVVVGTDNKLTSVRHFPHQMDGRAYSKANGTDGGGVKTV